MNEAIVNTTTPLLENIPKGQEPLYAIIILAAAIIIAKIIRHVFIARIKKLAEKTHTELDDILVDMVSKPVYYIIIFFGAYLASKTVETLIPYFDKVEMGFLILGTLLGAWTAAKVISFFITLYLEKERHIEKVPGILEKLITITIFAIALLILLGQFGVEISPLLATLGVGGLAVGLALQTTLSDFFAGMHLMTDKPIRVGDFIELEDGTIGTVEDIGWRSTRIRCPGDYTVVVPNSRISGEKLTNYSMPTRPTNIIVNCGVSYQDDLEKVEKATLDEAKKIQQKLEQCDPKWEPVMRYNKFGDSNIEFFVVLRAKHYKDRYTIIHEFIKALKKRYDKEGITIEWPVTKVYFGNTPPDKK